MKSKPTLSLKKTALAAALCGSGLAALGTSAHAGMVTDAHGNVGYDTAGECDAAVLAGTARFYQPITTRKAQRQAGEASVRPIRLRELVSAAPQARALGYNAADYTRGACDLGVRHVHGRPDITPELVGKWVPFGPDFALNLYSSAAGQPVRVTMLQCDNGFSGNLPRPVPGPAPVAQAAPQPAPIATALPNECVATLLYPAQFETRTEQVLKAPATQREEIVPATYKAVTEQVLVSPELRRQVPVEATYRTVTENVVLRPATTRDEPVAPVFRDVPERVEVKPASSRTEVIPAVYRTVEERVLVTPERKTLRVVPAVYQDVADVVEVSPASTRTVPVPPVYRTEMERVLLRPETVRYLTLNLPRKRVTEQRLVQEATTRTQVIPARTRATPEPVRTKDEGIRREPVAATYDSVTEQVQVSAPYREWRRGRAWVGQAVQVVPLRGFVVDPSGQFNGYPVQDRTLVAAARGGASRGVIDTGMTPSDNRQSEDDVMCLVDIPAQYETVTRQVPRTPAGTRDVLIPAEYAFLPRNEVVREAEARPQIIPAVYQPVVRMEIDWDAVRAQGYRFDAQGQLVATPQGERVLSSAVAAGQPGYEGPPPSLDGYVRETRLPAVYGAVARQVIDKPADVRTEAVAAVTRTVRRRELVTPERTEEVVVPAVYRTVRRQVVAQPETTREVPVPAEYQTVTRKELVQPASTRSVPVAAVVQPMARQVVDRPAGVRDEVVPAVYRAETRQVIDHPARTVLVDVPAVYETLTWKVKVAEAREERRSVLCETNASPEKIMEIQRALQRDGFSPGAVDGVLAQPTLNAVARYQQARGLPIHGYLDVETVRALGVAP